MPASQTKSHPVADSIETAAERKVAELNDKTVENGKKAGAAYIDSYEKAVVQLADGYEKAAGATKIEWLSTVATTQADFTREVTKAYTSAARELVTRLGRFFIPSQGEPTRAAAHPPRKGRRGPSVVNQLESPGGLDPRAVLSQPAGLTDQPARARPRRLATKDS